MSHQHAGVRKAEIIQDVHDAVGYMDSWRGAAGERANAAYTRDFSLLTPLDDQDVIPEVFYGKFRTEPNVVRLATTNHFRIAIDALDTYFTRPTSAEHRAAVVKHAGEQLDYQRHLGFLGLKYGMAITETTEKSITWKGLVLGRPRDHVTKLEFAAMIAAPSEPTDQDLAALDIMGYQGVKDVFARIKHYNSRPAHWRYDGKFISLPPSARPANRAWRQEAADDWAEVPRWEQIESPRRLEAA